MVEKLKVEPIDGVEGLATIKEIALSFRKWKRKPHKIMIPKADRPSEEELVRFEKYMNLMFEDINKSYEENLK
jgi:hypothetical protein